MSCPDGAWIIDTTEFRCSYCLKVLDFLEIGQSVNGTILCLECITNSIGQLRRWEGNE